MVPILTEYSIFIKNVKLVLCDIIRCRLLMSLESSSSLSNTNKSLKSKAKAGFVLMQDLYVEISNQYDSIIDQTEKAQYVTREEAAHSNALSLSDVDDIISDYSSKFVNYVLLMKPYVVDYMLGKMEKSSDTELLNSFCDYIDDTIVKFTNVHSAILEFHVEYANKYSKMSDEIKDRYKNGHKQVLKIHLTNLRTENEKIRRQFQKYIK